jgi:hypothetical protein
MLTETDLLNYRGLIQESRVFKTFSKATAQVSIFLSHSHKDKELVEGFINYLAYSSEIIIYVDWQDSDMPSTTNRETALRIKEKIDQMDYFLILATRNAMESKWVPWEIGIADKTKSIERIAVVPIIDRSGQYHGNEYMQLYQSVQPGIHELTGRKALSVFEVNQDTGVVINSWFTK